MVKNINEEFSFKELKNRVIPALAKKHKFSKEGNNLRKDRKMYIDHLMSNRYIKREISLALGKSENYIYQLGVDRLIKVKQNKSTSLKTQSIAAGGKIIGTTLGSILSNMKNDEIMKQVTIVDTLHSAGYKEEDVITALEAPSIEEFKQIMNAVKLLSKKYEIIRKEK